MSEDHMKLQKLGGYASIALVCMSIAALGILIPILRRLDIFDPVEMITAYQTSAIAFWVYYVLNILSGVLILLVVLVLQERMHANAPQLMRLAVIAASVYFALSLTTEMTGIYRNVLLAPTKDVSAFRAFCVLHECLFGAAVNAWGWGFLFIGLAALRTRALPRILGCIILACAIVAIIQFAFVGSNLWLGLWQLLRFISLVWLGVVLLGRPEPGLGQAVKTGA